MNRFFFFLLLLQTAFLPLRFRLNMALPHTSPPTPLELLALSLFYLSHSLFLHRFTCAHGPMPFLLLSDASIHFPFPQHPHLPVAHARDLTREKYLLAKCARGAALRRANIIFDVGTATDIFSDVLSMPSFPPPTFVTTGEDHKISVGHRFLSVGQECYCNYSLPTVSHSHNMLSTEFLSIFFPQPPPIKLQYFLFLEPPINFFSPHSKFTHTFCP